jgi:hypothetical protein
VCHGPGGGRCHDSDTLSQKQKTPGVEEGDLGVPRLNRRGWGSRFAGGGRLLCVTGQKGGMNPKKWRGMNRRRGMGGGGAG